MFIVFWDILMFDQVSLSPQAKRSVIISQKLVYASSHLNDIKHLSSPLYGSSTA